MLELTDTAIIEMFVWAERHSRVEVCGLVWKQEYHPFTFVRPMRNIHSQPDKFYEIDTLEMKQAYEEMDVHNGQPVAFYHSHPGGSMYPSETDMQGALNVGMYYLILYPLSVSWWMTAWECLEPGILVESKWRVSK
jgi:desampylase